MRFLRNPYTLVAITALCVRALYCTVIVCVFDKAAPGGWGHDGYTELAHNLVAGEGYRLLGELTFFRTPTYVLFLVPWVSLPGSHFWILAAQSIVGALTCGMVTKTAMRFVSPRRAILAGMAVAFCPWHVHFTANGMTPILVGLMTMGLLMLWLEDRDEPRLLRAALSGVLFGLLALGHPGAVLLGPAWIVDRVWSAIRRDRFVSGMWEACLFGCLTVIVISPWVIRNRVASGEWIVLSNSAGFQFFVADVMVSSAPTLFSQPVGASAPGLKRAAEALDEAGFPPSNTMISFKGVGNAEAKVFKDWMRNDLRTHPEKLPRRLYLQGWWFWFADRPGRVIFHIIYKLPILLLALIGVWRGLRRRENIGPMLICTGAFWFTHALVMGHIPLAAYCLTILGPVCILAAMGLQRDAVQVPTSD